MIEERDYDPQTVSNKFAIGEYFEYIQDEWIDEQGERHIWLQKALIEHIRSRVIILALELPTGEIEHRRTERYYLSRWIYNKDLRETMDVHDAIPQPQERKHKPVQPEILHAIYTISDPRDGLVRYVGTSTNTQVRFQQHLNQGDLNFKKNAWIQELLNLEIEPIFTIIEENINGARTARERENYWIQYYRKQGAPLTDFAKMRGVQNRDTW